MKRILTGALVALCPLVAMAQMPGGNYPEKEVYSGPDIIFRQIDAHTWEGNGHLMANETVYLVEGAERALLIDAGTKIADLDKIAASLTSKPITLVATHVHPDHTGSAVNLFPEIYINAADMVNVASMMKDYKGEIKYLVDGEIIDLGGRQIEVVFTPGHTPGSTTFFDKAAGYGFSGDSFGSGNLLLITNFQTLQLTCQRIREYMAANGIRKLYPGHYHGGNPELPQRIADLEQIAKDAIAGNLNDIQETEGMLGLNRVIVRDGVRVNFSDKILPERK